MQFLTSIARKSFITWKMFKNTEIVFWTSVFFIHWYVAETCGRRANVTWRYVQALALSLSLSLTGQDPVVVVTLGGATWLPLVSRPAEAVALPRHWVTGRRECWLARGTWQPGVPLKLQTRSWVHVTGNEMWWLSDHLLAMFLVIHCHVTNTNKTFCQQEWRTWQGL